MLKIGIVTFHRAHNYGASLQCIALVKTIQSLSKEYDVKVINYCNEKIDYDYSLFRIDNTNLKTKCKSFISSLVFINKNYKRRNIYNKYINNAFPLTKEIYDSQDPIFNDFDVLICGSDQIWNSALTGGIDNIYFLNVKGSAKKISYAASLGSNKLDDNQELYEELLNNLNAISVREKDGCEKVGKLLKRKIENVLDPTLLIDVEEWKKYLTDRKEEKYIFVYSPNNLSEFPKLVNYFSKKTSYGIINFAKKNMGYNKIIKNMYCSNPIDFLNYINNSELVVVTSFHAVVFSILFHKKFWVISPNDNNSRVGTLLSLIGLEKRIFNSMEELNEIDIYEEINYEKVDKKIAALKKDSISWLARELSNIDE